MPPDIKTADLDLPSALAATMTAAQRAGEHEEPSPDELLRLITILGLSMARYLRRLEELEAKLNQ